MCISAHLHLNKLTLTFILSHFSSSAISVLRGGVDISDHRAQTQRGSDCLFGDDSATEAKALKRTAKELTSDLDG